MALGWPGGEGGGHLKMGRDKAEGCAVGVKTPPLFPPPACARRRGFGGRLEDRADRREETRKQ